MAINDLSFLFLLFPVILLAHKLVPGMLGKNIVLLLGSLLFFAWGSPEYLFLMAMIILFNYFTGLEMAARKKAEQDAKPVLVSAVAVNLLLLGFFKYWGFLLENVNALLGLSISVRDLPMPIGVSFFTFSVLSYLFDVYRDKAPAAKNILEFSLFVTFFPKLVSGPIVQYAAMEKQLKARKLTKVKFGKGCRLFLIGLSKKVLLANNLGTTFYAVTALPADQVSVATAWLGAVSYSLMLYFDFGGYSDMAIGLGEMFGFDFGKNFDYPYISASVSEFWRRWHISLGSWFRDYVYIPLGGSRVETGKIIRNLLIVWALTGIWHGAAWNFVFWGLYYGLILLVEKFVLKSVLEVVPTVLRQIGTVLLVVIGWVFFFSPSLDSAFTWLARMFGIGAAGLIDGTAKYYLSGSAILLIISALGAIPFPAKQANQLLKSGNKVPVYLSVAWFALLLILCIAGMMVSTYSSFLYFQF
ncbi:MAG: MBOAT family protein [Oscillospiraceae bacterium]|nr:MBOAT family protein [Oscillospiraceae bacterium]